MAAPVYLSHPAGLEHDTGQHPESPARILAIERELGERGWLGLRRVQSQPVARATLEAVHPSQHTRFIEQLCIGGGGRIDADTLASPGSWDAALHGAGGAVQLVDILLTGEAASGFSAHRPPGHHAEANRAMGFCLFNNVAVAARHALDVHGLERVLVLDWDVHHGNGTNDIFHSSAALLYISIHQYPLFPIGTGMADDVGSGAGEGYTVNLPVPARSGDARYLSLLTHVVAPLARAFEPQLVLVSAGYDAHGDDPLADCTVSVEGFRAMTSVVRRVSEELGAPLGFVLEGGYALDALASSVAATLEVLVAPGPGAEVEAGVDPLAVDACERLARWWQLPAL